MSGKKTLEQAKAKYMAEVDPVELAIRIIEAESGLRRPPGTAQHAFDSLEPDTRDRSMRAAVAALNFVSERFAAAKMVG